jgi:hypothetical protein
MATIEHIEVNITRHWWGVKLIFPNGDTHRICWIVPMLKVARQLVRGGFTVECKERKD